MDEPTSALDPISTLKIEELCRQLKNDYTIIIVTHNMQQATRISDKTAFSCMEKSLNLTAQRRCFLLQKTENIGIYHRKIRISS